jgi:hypothetical protein
VRARRTTRDEDIALALDHRRDHRDGADRVVRALQGRRRAAIAG